MSMFVGYLNCYACMWPLSAFLFKHWLNICNLDRFLFGENLNSSLYLVHSWWLVTKNKKIRAECTSFIKYVPEDEIWKIRFVSCMFGSIISLASDWNFYAALTGWQKHQNMVSYGMKYMLFLWSGLHQWLVVDIYAAMLVDLMSILLQTISSCPLLCL